MKSIFKKLIRRNPKKKLQINSRLKDLNKNSFRQILKRSASIYERSGFQLFKTTTGIQSRPGAFDKLRLVMNFLTNLKVTTGYYSVFRLVLENKAGKEIPGSSRIEFS